MQLTYLFVVNKVVHFIHFFFFIFVLFAIYSIFYSNSIWLTEKKIKWRGNLKESTGLILGQVSSLKKNRS